MASLEPREDLEEHWAKLLNNNRMRPTTRAGDHRAQFERDYDRAVFLTPVCRLQDKTQAFSLDPSDAVRTRLTHFQTLERR
jgi:dGTPase